MPADQIDLSAGLVPSAPPAAPADNGIDLSSGLVPSTNTAAQPSAVDRAVAGVQRSSLSSFGAPQTATEHVVDAITGGTGAGLVAWRAAKSLVDSVKNAMDAKKPDEFAKAKADVQRTVQDFHNRDYRNLAADAGSVAGDVVSAGGTPIAGLVGNDVRNVSEGTRPGGDLAGALGQTAGDATVLAASAIPGLAEGEAGVAGDLEGSANAATHAYDPATGTIEPVQPGIVKQIVKGEDVAQPSAQSALRQGAKAGGDGLNTVQPQSIRTVLEEPIDTLTSSAKADYRAIDQAAGTDFKALNEKLANTEYQIRQLTGTEEDVAQEAKLEASRTALTDKIETAKQQAISSGVDPKLLEQADAKFTQARALADLEAKVFKNTSVVSGNYAAGTPETVNVNSAVKALQKLQDTSKFGASRLEQALGKEGANSLLKDLYAAQRSGVKALSRQQMVIKIAKLVGKSLPYVGTAAVGAYELLK
jgi:hypothetical protein